MLKEMHALLALTSACAVIPSSSHAVSPTDCVAGRSDNTCAGPVLGGDINRPPYPQPPNYVPLAGVPESGYWYWGYDFQRANDSQQESPKFVNRSGREFALSLRFQIPNPPCGNDCLPGIEFIVDGKSRFPTLQTVANIATATTIISTNSNYGWIIGLWSAHDTSIGISSLDHKPIEFGDVGLGNDPSALVLIKGTEELCTCSDGSSAVCNPGDHYSTGLSATWKDGSARRIASWTLCPNER